MLNRWALTKKEKPCVCFTWLHHLFGSKHAGPLIVRTLALSPALQIANDNSFPSSKVLLVKYCQFTVLFMTNWVSSFRPCLVYKWRFFFLFCLSSHRWYSLTLSVYHNKQDQFGLLLRQVTLEPRKQIDDQLCTFRLDMEPVADVRSVLSLRVAWRYHKQAGACDVVLSQCSHLSFGCSVVLSHVGGHVARVEKKTN